MDRDDLPITGVMDELRQVLAGGTRAVLQAPPGAGKTTQVPLALLDAPWLVGRRIVMLAPRRLAARAAAARMADLLGEPVGRTVGYRVRMDSRVSAATRIEVVTEGVLTRRLQADPALSDTGLVIFDEFHERSLEADLGLALCLDMQEALNPDLRLLVMSATLETDAVAALLDPAPVIVCAGRPFAVETRYVGAHTPENRPDVVAQTVRDAARQEQGSVLVFLPGAGEIRRVARQLEQAGLGPRWRIAPLFGNMARKDQDAAIRPAPEGTRKIVLATDIAETSLTIEGIRVVVDSGLQRRPRFDPGSGLTRLATLPISRASARQRKGRAGRTGPGVCLRLWSQSAHGALPPAHRPEILEADLASLALELAMWGVSDPKKLRWLDPPPVGPFEAACALLRELEALDAGNRILDPGREMAKLPLHPRLAHMLIKAGRQDCAGPACDLAAILSEGDPLHFEKNGYQADLQLRLDLVQSFRHRQAWQRPDVRVDRAAVRRIIRTAANLRHRLGTGKKKQDNHCDAGALLAWAYPDRVAMRRPGQKGSFLLSNGRGAVLDSWDELAGEPFLVAAVLDGDRRNARMFQAVAYGADRLEQQFGGSFRQEESVVWDARQGRVAAETIRSFRSLVLSRRPQTHPDPEAVRSALLEGIRQAGLACLPWTKKLAQWRQRVCFLHGFATDALPWPDVSDERLLTDLDRWLGPYLNGMSRLRDLAGVDLARRAGGLVALSPAAGAGPMCAHPSDGSQRVADSH